MLRKTACLLIALGTISFAFTIKPEPKLQRGFAVVELFTSEGCSSCPPADALIAKIAKENEYKPMYILAYHVDYWDRLGWKDSFSDRRCSQRQNQYASWLNLNSVYTPQIVVNGSRECIGSDEKTLRQALAQALSEAKPAQLDISIEKQSASELSVTYKTGQQTPGYNLLLAWISPSASNKIERGENKGRTLSHIQIVRNFQSYRLDGQRSGTVSLAAFKGAGQRDEELIAFLQDAGSGKITAATKLKIIPEQT